MKYEVFEVAGPLRSRAAKAIGFIDDMINYSTANAPLAKELDACERCLSRGSGNRDSDVFWEAVLPHACLLFATCPTATCHLSHSVPCFFIPFVQMKSVPPLLSSPLP